MEQNTNIYDLERVFRIVLAFNSVSDRTILLSIILTNMMEITSSDAGTLYIKEDDHLHFRIIQNKTLNIFESSDEGNVILPPISLSEDSIQNVSAYAAINNEVVVIDDIYTDKRFNFKGSREYDKITGYKTKAMFTFPICAQRNDGDEVLGVIQLINPKDDVTGDIGTYGSLKNQSVVLALIKIAANTLLNLTHVSELQMFFRSFAAAMTHAIDERSKYNSSHTQNVAQYCEQFAKYLSAAFPQGHKFHFNAFHIESLTLAALLHDLGKIITPLQIMDKSNRLSYKMDSVRYRFGLKKLQIKVAFLEKVITPEEYEEMNRDMEDTLVFIEQINAANFITDEQLEKIALLKNVTYSDISGNTVRLLDDDDIDSLSVRRGTLTEKERRIMEEHVNVTSRLLEKIPFRKYYANVPEWAACHHEFLDGSGYPKGLKGSDIPLEANIITIMDIFDALIDTNRPYKKGVSVEKALIILTEMAEAGKLHSELVELFKHSKVWENVKRV